MTSHGPRSSTVPTRFALIPTTHIHVDITESGTVNPSGHVISSLTDSLDVPSLYRLAEQLGAMLDVSAPASGPFRMTVRLPATGPHAFPAARPQPAEASVSEQPSEAAPATLSTAAPDIASTGRTERRSHPRVEVALSAKIRRGSTAWQGTVASLSVGGASIRVPDDFPAILPQEASIWATTAIATLELSGLVYLRTSSGTDSRRSVPPETHLIVHFREPTPTETAVLASLIAAACERSLTFSLDVRLPRAPGLEATGQPLSFDLAEHDRRETVRIPTALNARLETRHRQEPANRLQAQVINLSRSGACCVVGARPEALEGIVQIHFAPPERGLAGHARAP